MVKNRCKRDCPWIRTTPWRRAWQPTPVYLTGESLGQRSLAGYSPQDWKSWTTLKWFSTHPHNDYWLRNSSLHLESCSFLLDSITFSKTEIKRIFFCRWEILSSRNKLSNEVVECFSLVTWKKKCREVIGMMGLWSLLNQRVGHMTS